jgi:hypothetical protein
MNQIRTLVIRVAAVVRVVTRATVTQKTQETLMDLGLIQTLVRKKAKEDLHPQGTHQHPGLTGTLHPVREDFPKRQMKRQGSPQKQPKTSSPIPMAMMRMRAPG